MQDVARSLSANYRITEAEDVEQEIWLAFAANWQHLDGKPDAYIRSAAKRAGTSYCERERYDYTFNTAQFVYTTSDIRGLLAEAFFGDAAWLDAPRKEYGAIESAMSGGLAVAMWDLADAFGRLKPHEQRIIRKRYVSHDTLTANERREVSRAIEVMAGTLNRAISGREAKAAEHDGPGARHAISNAQAQAMTKAAW